MRFNPFKKKTEKSEIQPPKVEIAVVLYQYENGGRTVGDIRAEGIMINGKPPKRQATLRDLRRMCGEVLEDLQSINVVDRLLQQATPQPQPKPAPIEEVKPEAPKEEPKNEDAPIHPEAPKEPERPTP
jgi:hypothetical protein